MPYFFKRQKGLLALGNGNKLVDLQRRNRGMEIDIYVTYMDEQ